jgi:hypothetical protein
MHSWQRKPVPQTRAILGKLYLIAPEENICSNLLGCYHDIIDDLNRFQAL